MGLLERIALMPMAWIHLGMAVFGVVLVVRGFYFAFDDPVMGALVSALGMMAFIAGIAGFMLFGGIGKNQSERG